MEEWLKGLTIISDEIAFIVFVIFLCVQIYYFRKTQKYRNLFSNFFKRQNEYSKIMMSVEDELYPQLVEVGTPYSDFNELIKEINLYVIKTKGTTDFSVIQNKVERKLNMRYDQSMTHLSFPTYYQ